VLAVIARRLHAADVAIATVAAAISVLAFDLFPGPTALLALAVGGAGWLQAWRGRRSGRRLLSAFVGMDLGAATIVVLALAAH
jgi:hypothetical protein